MPDPHEVPTCDEPAENERRQQNEDTEDRGVVEERRVRRQRERRARREDAGEGADPHEDAAECPHAEPRALRAQGGPERKRTPPPANDQIDDSERERDDAQYQRQTCGPTTRSTIGEEEAVGRAKRSPDARVERADQRLGRATELTEPLGCGCRAGDGRRGRPVRRERDRRQSGGEETALLVERERHSEVDELRRNGRKRRADADLLRDAGRRCPNEGASGRHGPIARDRKPGSTATEVVEDDDRDRVARQGRGRREPGCAGTTECACVRRHEDEGVLRKRVGPELLRREPSRDLDERRRTGGVLAERLFRSCVVAMSNEDDRLLRTSRYDRDDVAKLDRAEVGERLRPDVLLGLETE